MKVVFELVIVKPTLPHVDARVRHNRGPVSSEAVGYLGAPNASHDGPHIGKEPGENASQERILFSTAAGQKPGALHVVVSLFEDRRCQPRDFARVILSISRHDYEEFESIFERVLVALPYRVAYSVSDSVLYSLYWNSYLPARFLDGSQCHNSWLVCDHAYFIDIAWLEAFDNSGNGI